MRPTPSPHEYSLFNSCVAMALIWIILACFPVEGKFRAEEIRIDKFLGARRARCKMYVDHFAMRPLRPITESVLQQTIL